MGSPDQGFTRNLILSSLSGSDWALLQPHLERVKLSRGSELLRAGEPIEHLHFPEGGVASLVSSETGDDVEVGLIGREGFVGTAVMMGTDQAPDKSFMQIDHTTALRIERERLQDAIMESETLRTVLLRFAHVLHVQSVRTAVANAGAEIPQRLARWLLMCHDRVEGDTLVLTHEFISMMLAVRRSGVTVALHLLEGTGAVRSTRGEVLVRDRSKLRELAGEIYGVPEAEYRRLLGPFGKSD